MQLKNFKRKVYRNTCLLEKEESLPGMLVYTCNFNTWEAEAEGSCVRG
jgi:hypothetical protein